MKLRKPEMTIVRFDAADVICTSGGPVAGYTAIVCEATNAVVNEANSNGNTVTIGSDVFK